MSAECLDGVGCEQVAGLERKVGFMEPDDGVAKEFDSFGVGFDGVSGGVEQSAIVAVGDAVFDSDA